MPALVTVLSVETPTPSSPRAGLLPPLTKPISTRAESFPKVDVIVAYRNEAALIGAKVKNLLALDYPANQLRFLMVDGGSTDGCPAAARRAAARDGRFRWLSAPDRGKTRQLNRAFARSGASWILVTDADARMPPGALRLMIAKAIEGQRVGLVGTVCHPRRAIAVDRAHWGLWNWVRQVEDRLGCATALGPCYLLRREAFSGWPDDVIADDVHASLAINKAGWRAVLTEAIVLERRAPSGVRSFVWHKVRKARAVVREFVRFLPGAISPKAGARAVFLLRAAAILVGPFALLGSLLVGAFLWPKVVLMAGLALACSWPLATVSWPIVGPAARCLRAVGMVFVLSLVLAVAILTCPFVRQTPQFCRWKQEEA